MANDMKYGVCNVSGDDMLIGIVNDADYDIAEYIEKKYDMNTRMVYSYNIMKRDGQRGNRSRNKSIQKVRAYHSRRLNRRKN